ncbi:peptidoglycan editing factor PgeF [Roseburia sp. 499]|uniref:peptidoglycan editing factor PgeF n=1 Tax=Roseburia sp. 499 TaxID=1261634 RepID=UPI000950D008|nr:peptidoglycan editing factor PgeF [Roseburia sp. 499]WVK70903.1 peptidoglycan editing factor PgeF [Roseburia sp. 499]
MVFKKTTSETVLDIKEQNGFPMLVYPLLEQTGIVKHCFTTRQGGVSEGIFESLNLSFTRGDKKEAVEENFRRVAKALGTEYENFVFTDQTHTTNVKRVGKEDAGKGLTKERGYTDVDGLISNEPGIVLSTFYADCVPLYFVDPVHRAIGLSHSGWRGTVGRMGKVTLEAMNREFGTRPEEVICAIGPSICQSCYEISEDVAVEFKHEFHGHEEEILIEKGNGKYQLDLWRTNELILLEAGVRQEHLAVTNICTCCNDKLLFSHRASQGKRGNLGAFLALV